MHPWVSRCRPSARPLVFAHRGGAALAPENTLAAFEQAAALAADGFELDVRLSRDGDVVVIHDADVARTTSGAGPVASFTAEELSRLDAGHHFIRYDTPADTAAAEHPFRGRGVGVPRLRDVLQRFPDVPLIVELKGRDPLLARRAVAIAREERALDRLCFGGFSSATLRAARACGADVCTSASREETRWALYRSWVHWPSPPARYQAFQVPELAGTTRVVSPRFLHAGHDRDLLIQVWTVNDVEAMTRLVAWGVDGLITDRPDLAVSLPLPLPRLRAEGEGETRRRDALPSREAYQGRDASAPPTPDRGAPRQPTAAG